MSATGLSFVQAAQGAIVLTFHELVENNGVFGWAQTIISGPSSDRPCATISDDGRTIVATDAGDNSWVRTFFRNPSTGAWSQTNMFRMNGHLFKSASLSSNGKVLALTSQNGGNNNGNNNNALIYAWSGSSWTTIANLYYDVLTTGMSISMNSNGTRFVHSRQTFVDVWDLAATGLITYSSSAPARAPVGTNEFRRNQHHNCHSNRRSWK
jgi:hypothetical protein